MDDNFSESIKEIIAISKKEAIRINNGFLDTSHLIYGIIEHKNNKVFKEFFFDRKQAQVVLNYLETISSESNQSHKKNDGELNLTRRANRAIKTSFLEAKLFQSKEINEFHLFLCILRNENDDITVFLNSIEISYDSVKSVLKRESRSNEEKEKSAFRFFYSEQNLQDNQKFKVNIIDDNNSKIRRSFATLEERVDYLRQLTFSTEHLTYLYINKLNKIEVNFIKRISTLKALVIENSILESLKFLKEFEGLISLDIISCHLDNPRSLRELKKLKSLSVKKCELLNIDFVRNLKKLTFFDFSFNQVSDLSPLKNILKDRLKVFFFDNEVKILEEFTLEIILGSNYYQSLDIVKVLKNLIVAKQKYEEAAQLRDYEKKLEKNEELNVSEKDFIKGIYLDFMIKSNSIETPPPKLIYEGFDDVKEFFDQIKKEKSKTSLFEGKLLVVGEGGTGKTSFTRKIENLNAILPYEDETTFNIDINQVEFAQKLNEESKMFINIWDFGGQKIYRGTHQLFFSDQCLYVLVDDNREEKTDFSYWLNTIQQLGGRNSKVIIIINLKHGRNEVCFDDVGYKEQFGDLDLDVVPIDLKDDKFKLEILRDLIQVKFRQLPHVGKSLPDSWVHIREKLSSLKYNYISFDKFRDICSDYSINEKNSIDTLCSYYNNIGVITYYKDDPILRERIYLDSNWLVKTIYEVLDNKVIGEKKGIVDLDTVKLIWNDELELERLCALTNRFGLMYHDHLSNMFIVPEKMSRKKPYDVWKWEDNEKMKFRYKFSKYSPKGLMSKLIVSLNKYIVDYKLVWHKGMNLEYQNTYAEIIETYSLDNIFEIKIVGENKKGLLALIIDKFDDILKPYKALEVEKLIQCKCAICLETPNPTFFKYSDLLKRIEKGVSKVECDKEYKYVSVNELIEGISNSNNDMKIINIFLASSSELIKERDQVEIFINRENKKMIEDRVFLKLNRWEDFIDAMSQTRLQDEYNKVAMDSHIFLSLFSTKVGKYTEEEFERAYESFKEKNKPKFIFTFFKNEKRGMNEIDDRDYESLKNFKAKLDTLGHYRTSFEDDKDLTRQLKIQLDKIIDNI